MQNYPALRTHLQHLMTAYQKDAPATIAGFGQLHKAALEPKILSTKTKELIALAIGIAVHCDGCIAYHVCDALQAGASRQEISEATEVAIMMGGGPALVYGVQAFEALEQFEAQPKLWQAPAIAT
jgi:AhpD family alkylhydroperoxidase